MRDEKINNWFHFISTIPEQLFKHFDCLLAWTAGSEFEGREVDWSWHGKTIQRKVLGASIELTFWICLKFLGSQWIIWGDQSVEKSLWCSISNVEVVSSMESNWNLNAFLKLYRCVLHAWRVHMSNLRDYQLQSATHVCINNTPGCNEKFLNEIIFELKLPSVKPTRQWNVNFIAFQLNFSPQSSPKLFIVLMFAPYFPLALLFFQLSFIIAQHCVSAFS